MMNTVQPGNLFIKNGRNLFLLLCLVCSLNAKAQIEVSSGIDMSYPLLLNSNNSSLYYNQVSFGVRVGVSYKPTGTQFFPTLYYSIGQTTLPLKQFENNVSTLVFRYQHVMLNGNFVISFENNNALYLIGGIGFSDLKEKFPSISGTNGLAMSSHIDSTKNTNRVFPAMGIGMEYVYGASANRPIYISMGLYLQYVLLLAEQNTYNLTIIDAQKSVVPIHANLSGNLLIPTFSLTLHYMLGKGIILWQKKKSSFYL